jgi:hypothetical protein
VNDRLLTTRQVADYLGFSPETALRRYRAGKLVSIVLSVFLTLAVNGCLHFVG